MVLVWLRICQNYMHAHPTLEEPEVVGHKGLHVCYVVV